MRKEALEGGQIGMRGGLASRVRPHSEVPKWPSDAQAEVSGHAEAVKLGQI